MRKKHRLVAWWGRGSWHVPNHTRRFFGVLLPLIFIACAHILAREDFTGLALKIAKDELKEDGWQKFLKSAESRADQFIKDNQSGSRLRMLNEIIEALARKLDGVDLGKTKQFVYWMAVFSEWNEALPDCVLEELSKHESEYAELRENFSWDKLQAIIKAEIDAAAAAKKQQSKK